MHIRYATKDDAAQIMRLFYDTVHAINSRDYTHEQVDVWAPGDMNLERWCERQDTRTTLVAESDGQILGFAELEASEHIDCFYVHKDYQGQGVGARLLQAIVEMATIDIHAVKLFAEVSITARPFFERHAFKVIHAQDILVRGITLRNYVMERRL